MQKLDFLGLVLALISVVDVGSTSEVDDIAAETE